MAKQRIVLVSDNGESWLLNGDKEGAGEKEAVLPALLEAGWVVASATTGSGSKDDSSYWLVVLSKP